MSAPTAVGQPPTAAAFSVSNRPEQILKAETVKDIVTTVYEHTVVGVGICLILCATLSHQGGEFNLQGGGAGVIDRGPYVGWAGLPPKKRGNLCDFVAGDVGVGASFSSCSDVYTNRADPNDWEVDIFPCGPSFAGGAMQSAPLNTIYHWILG